MSLKTYRAKLLYLILGLVVVVGAELLFLPPFIGGAVFVVVPITFLIAIFWSHKMAGPIPILEEDLKVRMQDNKDH